MSKRQDLARMIGEARRIVAFTGAGISTESGIPDFRSPGGVWSRMKPIQFQDFVRDPDMRREAWTRAFSGRAGWTGRAPNAGQGRLSSVITQNVDNLHQDSGLPPDRVIELHGNASYAACLECGLRHELADLRDPFLERGEIPACRDCAGLVKTATISFGQTVPADALDRAAAETRACDLFLVLHPRAETLNRPPMIHPKNNTFTERQAASAAAKKALLAKLKPKPAVIDPNIEQRRAERELELELLREERQKEREARRAEAARLDAIRREEEAITAEARELVLRAAQKAARDARYAARKQRRK
jgi:NAD-dependent deacetylase